MAKLKVEVIVGLIDRLTKPMRGLTSKLNRAALGLAAGGASSIYAGKQILEPFQNAVTAAADLSGQLAEVRIVSGASAEAIASIRPEIRNLAADAIQGTDAVAGSLKDLVAKGLGLQSAMGALPAIGMSATAAGADIADMTNTAAALMQNLKIGSSDVQRSLDMLTVAGNAGAFELKDMAKSLPVLTASMSILGQTGEDAVGTLGAALQVVQRGAGDSAQAANNLNNLLTKITAPVTVNKLRKNFGVDLPAAMEKWKAEGKNTFEEFIALTKQLTGGDAIKIGQIFEDMQVQAALKPLLQGMDDYRDIKAKAESALGAAAKQFETRVSDDPRLRLARLAIQVGNLTDRIGTALLPTIERLVKVVTPWVNKLGGWIDKNRELTSTIALVTAGFGGALLVVGPLALGLAAVSSAVSVAIAPIRAVGAALTWLLPIVRAVSIALLANPIGLVVGAIALAAALIYKYWEPIKGFFSGFWDGLTSGLGDISATFESAFGPVMPIIRPVIDGVGWLIDAVGKILQPVDAAGGAAEDMGRRFGTVTAKLIAMPAKIIAEFLKIPARLGEITTQLIKVGGDWVSGLWQGMKAKWAEFSGWITEKVNSIAGIFRKETKTKSPSQVFADIGADLMAGLQLGLGQRQGAVLGDMRRLAAAVTIPMALSVPAAIAAGGLPAPQAAAPMTVTQPAMPAAIAQARGGTATRGAASFTIHVTNNIQAPAGSDERRLAALVEDRMKAVSGHLVRKLSSFYDDEDDV